MTANAHDFEVAGIYYNITDETNKTVGVTFRGSSYSAYSNEYTSNVKIPETVTYNYVTYSVTSIGNYAFEDCSGLTSITIPNSEYRKAAREVDDIAIGRYEQTQKRGNSMKM